MTRRSILVGVLIAVVLGACSQASAPSGDFVEIPGLGATRIDVPRPVTVGEGSCTLAMRRDETASERIHALRAIGLFADREALSDADLAAQVEGAIAATWGDLVTADDELYELFVAEQDQSRTWWRDLEADVADGNGVYVATIEDWSAISVGAFAPSAIEETWASFDGPVTITFELEGVTHTLEPEYFEDWIDPRIATAINDLIGRSGRQIAMFEAFDQTAFVMVLTPEERSALEARGWCFS